MNMQIVRIHMDTEESEIAPLIIERRHLFCQAECHHGVLRFFAAEGYDTVLHQTALLRI